MSRSHGGLSRFRTRKFSMLVSSKVLKVRSQLADNRDMKTNATSPRYTGPKFQVFTVFVKYPHGDEGQMHLNLGHRETLENGTVLIRVWMEKHRPDYTILSIMGEK